MDAYRSNVIQFPIEPVVDQEQIDRRTKHLGLITIAVVFALGVVVGGLAF